MPYQNKNSDIIYLHKDSPIESLAEDLVKTLRGRKACERNDNETIQELTIEEVTLKNVKIKMKP